MNFNTKHILFICFLLSVFSLTYVAAVTDAELEALEKQIEQQEAEAKRKAEEKRKAKVEAKRKAKEETKRLEEEQKRKVEEEKQLAEQEKRRREEEKRLLAEEEQKRKMEEAKLDELKRQQQEEEVKRLALEEQIRKEEDLARLKVNILQYKTTDFNLSAVDYATANDLTFEVGMGNAKWGFGFAGAEIIDAKILKVKVTAPKTYKHFDANSFAGFIIDYFDGKNYVKRIMLGIGMLDKNRWGLDVPAWGLEVLAWGEIKNPDGYYDLGPAFIYHIDLQKWAPENWDGRIWFTLGIQNAGHGNVIKAIILEN